MKRTIPIMILFVAVQVVAQVASPAPEPKTTKPASWNVAGAPGTAARPMKAVELKGCVTADCHPGIKQHRILHGPVNVDACDACHVTQSVTEHTFTLKREANQLCGFCHVVETNDAKFVHEPLKTGDCMGCHNPHGGADLRFLKSNTFGQMCLDCHSQMDFTKHKSIHGPVASGECGGCHAAHKSNNEKLLLRTGRDMCLTCHKEMGQQLMHAAVVHKPVEEDCLKCHDPHASDHAMVTKAPAMQLCTDGCHEDVRTAVFDAKFKHSAVTQDAACSNCHTPHGGDLARLMKDRPVDVCMKCHDKPIEKDGVQIVNAVLKLTQPDLYKHGPVNDGSCGGCHNVHGSDIPKLLTNAYPKEFYQPFAVEKYELCFTCHDQATFTTAKSDRLTNFRDGEKNLHFLHVNKADRGRSCRACHDTHASNHQQHIRESVPYGKSDWELPLNFKPTSTGGSCAPGCHQELRYDRITPLNDHIQPDNDEEPPSTPATTVSAPADRRTTP